MGNGQFVKVTVLLTSLNYGDVIERALHSVLNQSLSRELYEIIVVDGNSIDNTHEILKKYDHTVKVVYQDTQRPGLSAACNIGLESAKGDYFVRLDADDTFEKDLLIEASSVLDTRSDIAFVYSDYFRVSQNRAKSIKVLPAFDADEIIERGDFLAGGTMVRRSVYDDIGGYDENLRTLESFDFTLRMIKKGYKGYCIRSPLFTYFIHDQSMSSDTELMIRTGRELGKKYGFRYRKNQHHPRV